MKTGYENRETREKSNSCPAVSEPTILSEDHIPLKIFHQQVTHIQEIIQNTVTSLQMYNTYELFSNNDMNQYTNSLSRLYENTKDIINMLQQADPNIEMCIHQLQNVTNELTQVISKVGTLRLSDIVYISFGSDFLKNNPLSPIMRAKYDLILQNLSPIGFKPVAIRGSPGDTLPICSNKNTDETIVIENANQLECFDADITQNFFRRCHEIKIVIRCEKTRKIIIISGIVSNLNTCFFSNSYIESRIKNLMEIHPSAADKDLLKKQIDAMTIKEILIHGDNDIKIRNANIQNAISNMKTTKLETITKNFVILDLFSKRSQLIDMLLYIKDSEVQYLAYLLYDLLTDVDNKNNEYEDSTDQVLIYNSLPWKTRTLFKDAMKNTAQYNQNVLSKYENTAISIEQQIIFWRVPDAIKERAFIKLKEVKGRGDDSGSKAKQYLEGLLRIPFETYRKEPVLSVIEKINGIFFKILQYSEDNKNILDAIKQLPVKPKYTNVEIQQYSGAVRREIEGEIKKMLSSLTKAEAADVMRNVATTRRTSSNTIVTANSSKEKILSEIMAHLENLDNIHKLNEFFIKNIMSPVPDSASSREKTSSKYFQLVKLFKYQIYGMELIREIATTKETIQCMRGVLDESIHGHDNAKKQIMKIMCQWMNGTQSGYCFGFEGSPGIGKTSLAKKGLAKCLADDLGTCRPFSFIALGGSCNGSTLEGHSYTYLNSTWGRIADILMESKCMNPIIYIDELDKVSKSEHGKEIIGILTHLIDSTQNDGFQDKYFSGIPLDLSKALFIFSYNDADAIDRILLDRIHRVKFDNLSLKEKITITRRFILPEINEKMGFHGTVELEDDTVKYIIEKYTAEPGVRKLKELLFDLYGEINIELLEGERGDLEFPIKITTEHLATYLKKYKKIPEIKIHAENRVGIMNGLWANMLGKGGVIPIETMFFPTENFLELKLTGLQGDVMKESMNVAKTLVWSMCSPKQCEAITKTIQATKTRGIHVHCPEGAVSKDGPSAGAAIVIAIYSLLNKMKIKRDVAITGEISLQGNITAIGGLDHKITGGIHAGIKTFIFPEENRTDFGYFVQKMIEQDNIPQDALGSRRISDEKDTRKYEFAFLDEKVSFILVSTIHEIFEHVFV
jgi:DNA polymerase III delta prime subunit